jgi:transcriptional regulator with XRE-family HTH domain
MSDRDSEAMKGLGEFIKSQRELAKLSLRQLADMAKVSNPYLSQIERGLYKPSADVLKQLAGALHLSAESFFAQAGLLDDDQAPGLGSAVEAAIKLDLHLSPDQKETLIRVYRSFAGEK